MQFQTKMVGVRCRDTLHVDHRRRHRAATTTAEVLRGEDNLRVPSGVSYMLMNHKMMMRLFPELFLVSDGAPGRALPAPFCRR